MVCGMNPDVARWGARHYGVASRDELEAFGLNDKTIRAHVRRGELIRRTERVFLFAGAPDTWRQRARAAVIDSGAETVLSHRSLAHLLEVPGFRDNRLEVTTPFGNDTHSKLAVVHRTRWLPPWHITTTQGIPATTPTRMMFDIAAVVSEPRAARALDNGLMMGLFTYDKLDKMLGELAERGRSGISVMRRLLELRGDGYVAPASELEAMFEGILTAGGEPIPRKQVNLGGDEWAGRVDYFDDPINVVWEIDGRRWHTALLDLEADQLRENELVAAGLTVVRFRAYLLRDHPENVLSTVRRVRRSRSVA